MKKSILALSAAAAIGGLGFAGAAQATYYFGPSVGGTYVAALGAPTNHTILSSNASGLRLNPGGLGHYLFSPYFTTQGDGGAVQTLISLVNTDSRNGKIVKVRFRSAANSEDLFDFQVYLSPSDVWNARLAQGAGGKTVITTSDKSCTVPAMPPEGFVFDTSRLISGLADSVKINQTREGYIEYLTMADVVPGSTIFNATKHVNNVAPCSAALAALSGDESNPQAEGRVGPPALVPNQRPDLGALGLSAPSTGLSGTWAIFRQDSVAAYGGNHVAVEATTVAAPGAAPTPGLANVNFAPQIASRVGTTAGGGTTMNGVAANVVTATTSDPIFTDPAVGPVLGARWNDLPDMSTPLFGAGGADAPLNAVTLLATQLAKSSISNEFALTPPGGAVPFDTDWVITHATRRYFATLPQTAGPTTPAMVSRFTAAPNAGATNQFYNLSNMVTQTINGGIMLCQMGDVIGFNREEAVASVRVSPSASAPYCGEVNVLSFGPVGQKSQVFSASVTNQSVTVTTGASPGVMATEGWARMSFDAPTANSIGGPTANPVQPAGGTPLVGFSAISARNVSTNGNFGFNNDHRFKP